MNDPWANASPAAVRYARNMKRARAKSGKIVRISGEQMRKLDARLRARELKLRAEGKLRPKLLLDPLDPRVRVVNLYKF